MGLGQSGMMHCGAVSCAYTYLLLAGDLVTCLAGESVIRVTYGNQNIRFISNLCDKSKSLKCEFVIFP